MRGTHVRRSSRAAASSPRERPRGPSRAFDPISRHNAPEDRPRRVQREEGTRHSAPRRTTPLRLCAICRREGASGARIWNFASWRPPEDSPRLTSSNSSSFPRSFSSGRTKQFACSPRRREMNLSATTPRVSSKARRSRASSAHAASRARTNHSPALTRVATPPALHACEAALDLPPPPWRIANGSMSSFRNVSSSARTKASSQTLRANEAAVSLKI